ncbi:two-component sensor histidine kinase [Acrocarpospora pleiomorpha]|uniref:histidine kinase n=1 Tax=Acrocarpospora pleiomorpha TaxID=90975 RepID=A0A5M3XPS9_9ACTN|nr:histidine kinase [Acrocarpospora pleiomorpha]GES22069.1 two-component sensor histidine kinase [Acrocarpospora pleiomorpha]
MGEGFVNWIQRLSEFALLGLLGMILLLETALSVSQGQASAFLIPVGGLTGLVAVLARSRFRVGSMVTLVVVSLVLTLAAAAMDDLPVPGMAEAGALMVLTISVLRWVRPLRGAVVLAGAALITLQLSAGLRVGGGMPGGVFEVLFFVGWAVGAVTGAYLRLQQHRREAAVEAVRRSERLDLARELHDLVAHHITGIVVQAQAARAVGEQRPETVLPALDAIATAGGEALTSMRRLVGVLRADEQASRSAGVDLADLRILVERFAAQGPRASFDIGHGVTDLALPPEVMTTLHRVLQESLTNVRRHAPGAAWVEAALSAPPDLVRLRVRNVGSPGDPRLTRLGGGFGLVGMVERVQALGGQLTAGPTRENGWEVVAEFPAVSASRGK